MGAKSEREYIRGRSAFANIYKLLYFRRMMKVHVVLATVLSCLAPGLAAADTEWLVAPYGWLPSVSVDQGFDDGSGGDGGGGEVISKIDFVAMLRVEAARGRWGAMLDYIYVSLADQTTLSPLPVISIDVDGDFDLEVVELGGFYRLRDDANSFDLIFGLRRIDVDLGIVLSRPLRPPQSLQVAAQIHDAFVGARYRLAFSQRWDISVRGDYGFGDSDGTLNVIAGLGLRFNDTFGLKFGYRYATIEFGQSIGDSPQETDISMSGPFIGLVLGF